MNQADRRPGEAPGSAGNIRGVSDMVRLSMHLPLVEMRTGDEVVSQGGPSGGVWILLSGALQVFKGDVAVNTITKAGAIVGEMSVLLGTDHGATVVATEPSTLRYAEDGHAFLFGDPRSRSSSPSDWPNA